MFKTKLILEVDCETQFGPEDARNMMTNLLKVPAITSTIVREITSDYKPLGKLDRQIAVLQEKNYKIK
jgi:hypothetical protein